MPKAFLFCRVCRRNHEQGRQHVYTKKHKERLDEFLSKAVKRIGDGRFFLKNPRHLTDSERQQNKFWCSFCEEEIREQGSTFACTKAFEHLASQQHVSKVKAFKTEHGADPEKLTACYLSPSLYVKWQDLMAKATQPAPDQSPDDIQTPAANNSAVPGLVNSSVLVTSLSSHPSPKFPSPANTALSDPTTPVLGLLETRPQHAVERTPAARLQPSQGRSVLSLHQGFAAVEAPPVKPGEGNVHTGAAPPWLLAAEGQQRGSPVTQSEPPPSKTKKLLPNRVGAAWSDYRRAQLARIAQGQEVEQEDYSRWLPSFGRVWQGGSRRETLKEFVGEMKASKKRDLGGGNLAKEDAGECVVELKPYTSKRQRCRDEGGD